jgi:hypothetical protein
MRSLVSFVVVLLTPFAASFAAPAPFPKADRSQTWELTLAEPSEEAYDAHRYLQSRRLLWDLAETEWVQAALARLSGAEDRERWLRRRLTVAVGKDGGTVVRVTAERDAARAVLGAFMAQVAGPPPTGARLEAALARKAEAQKKMWQLRKMLTAAPPGSVTREEREPWPAIGNVRRVKPGRARYHDRSRLVTSAEARP